MINLALEIRIKGNASSITLNSLNWFLLLDKSNVNHLDFYSYFNLNLQDVFTGRTFGIESKGPSCISHVIVDSID